MNKVLRVVVSVVVALLVFTVVGYILTDRIVMPFIVGSYSTPVEVPNLVGMNHDEASKIAEKAGLEMLVDQRGHSSEFGLDTIYHQEPPPGGIVRTNRRIRVSVSTGGQSVAIPLLRGLSINEAAARVNRFGLVPGRIIYQQDDSLAKDVVINSAPAYGKTVLRDSPIDLIVSEGPRFATISVPDFMGQGINNAVMMSRKLGLEIGTIRHTVVDTILPETVIGQSLSAGAQVGRGALIDFTVSSMD